MTADAEKKAPWWKSGLVAAALGAAIPVATLLQGHLQKRRELELQELEQLQELRMAYMNVMVEGGFDGVAMVADFIAETEPDSPIRTWALRQKKKAAKTVEDLEKKIVEQQKVAEEAAKKLSEAEERAKKAEEARLAEKAGSERRGAAEQAAEEARSAAARAEREARAREAAIARTRGTLQGRSEVRLDVPMRQIPMVGTTMIRTPAELPPR